MSKKWDPNLQFQKDIKNIADKNLLDEKNAKLTARKKFIHTPLKFKKLDCSRYEGRSHH